MLNWIWVGLVVIALGVAIGRDVTELSNDRFRNGKAIPCSLVSGRSIDQEHHTIDAFIRADALKTFYLADDTRSIKSDSLHIFFEYKTSGASSFELPADVPVVWQDMASAQGDEKKITGKLAINGDQILFIPDPVRYRILAKVVNDGILKTADTAVTIALGLIGVMALWLGIMKIAEAAGLITLLAKMAKPVMIRLFPDVPPEHPAMGAMLMNMAANMLGLSNAATPLGLKAMEELEKLNPIPGVATDAMCMFLTINTSAITIIPATVIAIRVSLGSHDPSDIIVPTFLATFIALICGALFNRFIQRFFPAKAQ
ncbi:MAG TPA: nucleoside recognition domain-containing protein [Steroidobacteraceae bacterium]|nr:nucleoside recognition domain-containing protein [Steroidobacteraceae bacterium]